LNSNFLLFIVLIFVCACGVKSDPIPPKDSAYPSYDTKFKKASPTPTPAPKNE